GRRGLLFLGMGGDTHPPCNPSTHPARHSDESATRGGPLHVRGREPENVTFSLFARLYNFPRTGAFSSCVSARRMAVGIARPANIIGRLHAFDQPGPIRTALVTPSVKPPMPGLVRQREMVTAEHGLVLGGVQALIDADAPVVDPKRPMHVTEPEELLQVL